MKARFISVSTASKRAGMSPKTLRRVLVLDQIAGALRTPGGHWRIPSEAFEAWLNPLATSDEKAAFENDVATLKTIRDVCRTHTHLVKRRKRVDAMDRVLSMLDTLMQRWPSVTGEAYEIACNAQLRKAGSP